MNPTIGRIVIYRYTEICSHGNFAEVCPAVVVRVWSDTCVNLKLLEDGNRNEWKTSVLQGDGKGQWQWPGRVEEKAAAVPLPSYLTESEPKS